MNVLANLMEAQLQANRHWQQQGLPPGGGVAQELVVGVCGLGPATGAAVPGPQVPGNVSESWWDAVARVVGINGVTEPAPHCAAADAGRRRRQRGAPTADNRTTGAHGWSRRRPKTDKSPTRLEPPTPQNRQVADTKRLVRPPFRHAGGPPGSNRHDRGHRAATVTWRLVGVRLGSSAARVGRRLPRCRGVTRRRGAGDSTASR